MVEGGGRERGEEGRSGEGEEGKGERRGGGVLFRLYLMAQNNNQP